MKLFFFDTETTGVNPGKDHIIQFAGIQCDYGKEGYINEESEINQFINVRNPIPEEAIKVHGITNEDLVGFGYIYQYIDNFLQIINEADYVIGHNVMFDIKMVKGEADRLDIPFDFSRIKLLDTMKLSVDLLKIPDGRGGYKYPKLSELFRYFFNCDFDNAHDALADIRATIDCFRELSYWNKYSLGKIFKYSFNINDADKKEIRLPLKFQGNKFVLKGLAELTNPQAEKIREFDGDFLFLDCLNKITDNQLETIIGYGLNDRSLYSCMNYDQDLMEQYPTGKQYGGRRQLSLGGLTKLTDSQAEILSKFLGNTLRLNGLKELSDNQAESLSKFKGNALRLDGLKEITNSQAESLSKFGGNYIYLLGLESLTETQKYILSNFKGELVY